MSDSIRLEFDDADVRALLDEAGKMIIAEITNDLYNKITQNIISMNLVGASTQLLNDITFDLENGEVHCNASHAGFVEFGTAGLRTVNADPYAGTDLAGPTMSPGRAGPPPLEAMIPWVRVKGLVRTKSGRKSTSKKQIENTAEEIRWHIYWHGTKPHPFFRNALDAVANEWNDAEITIEVSG